MSSTLAEHYIETSIKNLRGLKDLADKAARQVDDQQFFQMLDPESNSIALVMKHMAGNMRSRWTDFLTTDGEKPDRNRDSEFVMESEDRTAILDMWEQGWRYVFDAISPLTLDDLMRTVLIRQQPHSVMEAINRQLAHYGYHVGQIVFLAKHMKSAEWKSLSIPRNKSEEFNSEMKT